MVLAVGMVVAVMVVRQETLERQTKDATEERSRRVLICSPLCAKKHSRCAQHHSGFHIS